jgi:hypothetical protein
LGKVVSTRLKYSLQIVVFFDDLIRLIMVLRQELTEAMEVVLERHNVKKNFNKSAACVPMN